MRRKLKGCGKEFGKKDGIRCGDWFQGDQHFCKECFNKYYDEEGNDRPEDLRKKSTEELMKMAQPMDLCSDCETSTDGICEKHKSTKPSSLTGNSEDKKHG